MDGCDRSHNSLGWCKPHYDRFRRMGLAHLLGIRSARPLIRARIYAMSTPTPPDGCWEWIGQLTRKGYGTLKVGGRSSYAHRVSYEELIGPIPKGKVIDHLCENPACVNPIHLEPTSSRRNIALRSRTSLARWWSENLVPASLNG